MFSNDEVECIRYGRDRNRSGTEQFAVRLHRPGIRDVDRDRSPDVSPNGAMGQMASEQQPRHDGERVPPGAGEHLHIELAVDQCRTRRNVQSAAEELSIGDHDVDRLTIESVPVRVDDHAGLAEAGLWHPVQATEAI